VISLTKGEEDHQVLFRPWANVQTKEIDGELVEVYNKIQLPELSFKLIFGHICPKCGNVLQAAFFTDRAVDTRGYEEIKTTIRDEKTKELRVFRTGANNRFKSKYDSTLIQRGGVVSAQFIRLTEHFERTQDDGTTICHFQAYFSFRPDMAIQYVILNNQLNPAIYDLSAKNLEKLAKHASSQPYMKDDYMQLHDEAGGASTIWLVKRGAYNWVLSTALQNYIKKEK